MVDGLPQLAFLIEGEAISDSLGRTLLARLDQALSHSNIEYHAKRESGRYAPPTLRVVHLGEVDRYRRRMVDAGRADAQFKLLRLTADPTFAAQFAIDQEIHIDEWAASPNAGSKACR
jgi:GH3 auxin-responsive promoter